MIAAATGLSEISGLMPSERSALASEAANAIYLAGEAARSIGDVRALSLSYGRLGKLREGEKQGNDALSETLRALGIAQQNRIQDLIHLWQHQAGRILRGMGRTKQAAEMYRAAVGNLNLAKSGLPAECGTADGSFADMVKPVYLELADLLLELAGKESDSVTGQRLLAEARDTIEQLRTEELRDYFEDACLGTVPSARAALETVPPGTALLYTVILPDRIELLVTFPDGIKRFRVSESPASVAREARLLRLSIENRFQTWLGSAQKLYSWLILPLEKELKNKKITTLVFVPDGPLRNFPLSVLHDGNESIIASYAVATIQGLRFASLEAVTGRNGKQGMLLAGLSESVQGYPALTNVTNELRSIEVTHSGTTLLNNQFQVQRVREQLEATPYPLIHFASHGEFTGNAKDNYILTWEGKLTLDHLDRFIKANARRKTPVDLLSLSACRTAAGDDRAALGLAGLAVRSGARSAVASLWDIEDKSTSELFSEFYRILGTGTDRAEALRQAQIEVRKRYPHPYFWSPFLLIGSWI